MGISKEQRMELATEKLKEIIDRHGVLDITVNNDSWSDVADAVETIRKKALESGYSLTISVQVVPDGEWGLFTIFSLRPIVDVPAFVKALKATWK